MPSVERLQRWQSSLFILSIGSSTRAICTMAWLTCLFAWSTSAFGGYLHDAAQSGDPSRVKYLLEQGTDVNEKDGYSLTALHWAKDVAVIQVLLDADADVNATDNEWRQSPLHDAAFFGDPQIILLLLKADANVDAKNIYGQTPLHSSAKNLLVDAIEVLLSSGANVNARDNAGRTPLHLAAETWVSSSEWSTKLEATRRLLAAGADIDARDNAGLLPLDLVSGWPIIDRTPEGVEMLELLGGS